MAKRKTVVENNDVEPMQNTVGIERLSKKDIQDYIKFKSMEALAEIYEGLEKGDKINFDKLIAKQDFLSARSVMAYNSRAYYNSYFRSNDSTQKKVTPLCISTRTEKVTKKYVNAEDSEDVIYKKATVKICEVV